LVADAAGCATESGVNKKANTPDKRTTARWIVDFTLRL